MISGSLHIQIFNDQKMQTWIKIWSIVVESCEIVGNVLQLFHMNTNA